MGRLGDEKGNIYGDGLSVKFCRGVLNSQYTFAKISENVFSFLIFPYRKTSFFTDGAEDN